MTHDGTLHVFKRKEVGEVNVGRGYVSPLDSSAGVLSRVRGFCLGCSSLLP